MRKFLAVLLFLSLTFSFTGCGTLICAHDKWRISPLSGVETDFELISKADYQPLWLLFILDLPISFTYDLLLMPVAFARGRDFN